jgi:hypothetical protein
MRWRYHYPQDEFPYDLLRSENAQRGRGEPEYELVDTGVFDDDRYWAVEVDYAKADPTDMCIRITVHNRADVAATLHVLPTLWFRNTWSWGLPGRDQPPVIRGADAGLVAEHELVGRVTLTGDGTPRALFCDNETNTMRIWNRPSATRYPKDGINDHLVYGADSVNPHGVGTKAAMHYVVTVEPGESAQIRLRLTRVADGVPEPDLAGGFDEVLAARREEADAFFAALTPPAATAEEAMVVRRSVA